MKIKQLWKQDVNDDCEGKKSGRNRQNDGINPEPLIFDISCMWANISHSLEVFESHKSECSIVLKLNVYLNVTDSLISDGLEIVDAVTFIRIEVISLGRVQGAIDSTAEMIAVVRFQRI